MKLWKQALNIALGLIKDPKPKIVCICGSTRYPEALEQAYLNEVMAGHIPLVFLGNSRKWHSNREVKTQLDAMYKHKIEMADEILVLNVDGYVGPSTASEVKHARWLGKKIRWLEPNNRGEN